MSGIGVSPVGRLSMERSKHNGPRKSMGRKTINPRATMYYFTGAAAKLTKIQSNPLSQSSGPKLNNPSGLKFSNPLPKFTGTISKFTGTNPKFTSTIPKISVIQAKTTNAPPKSWAAALKPTTSLSKYTGTIRKQSQPKKVATTTADEKKCKITAIKSLR